MSDIKLIITAGCSYSQVPNSDVTWPVHLCEALDINGIYLGRGASGNGIISRLATYHITEALKTHKPEEILVGIMWSGADRHDMYSDDESFPHTEIFYGEDHEVYRNPLKIAGAHKHYILNYHWEDNTSVAYYKHLYDKANNAMITLEHILRMQYMLKTLGIRYIFMEYESDCLPHDMIDNPDIKYLYDLIDKNYFIEMNCGEFSRTISKYDFARLPDPHPSSEQHRDYTNQYILPYLLEKGYIKSYTPLEIDKYSMSRNGDKILLKTISV